MGTWTMGCVVLASCMGAGAGGPPSSGWGVTVGAEELVVRYAEAPVLVYRFANVPFKPYVKELFAPSGRNALLDAPSDHLHHHGLMFAVAVDGVDFWQEASSPGRQVHRRFESLGVKGDWVGFVERLDWLGPDSEEPLLRERREVRVLQDRLVTLVEWTSSFEVPEGRESVTIGGSHYFGLGMRFVRALDGVGRFVTPSGEDGELVRGEERLYRGAWCAYSGDWEGRPFTAAMFDSPDNPRAATWFTMPTPFAYLSATLNVHREPFPLAAGAPFALSYQVVLADSAVEPGDMDRIRERLAQWHEESAGNHR